MNILKLFVLLCLTFTAQAQSPPEPTPSGSDTDTAAPVPEPATVKVVLHTAQGDIVLAIETERAPITANNFLRYVDQKRFDGIGFYRAFAMDKEGHYGLIQAGLRGDPKKVLKGIAHEPTTRTGLSHTSGAISMARLAPGTADADFFIVLGDLTSLDAHPATSTTASGDTLGYAVFGHVIDGMQVVHAILDQPHSPTAGEGAMKGQMLKDPVKVLTVRRMQ